MVWMCAARVGLSPETTPQAKVILNHGYLIQESILCDINPILFMILLRKNTLENRNHCYLGYPKCLSTSTHCQLPTRARAAIRPPTRVLFVRKGDEMWKAPDADGGRGARWGSAFVWLKTRELESRREWGGRGDGLYIRSDKVINRNRYFEAQNLCSWMTLHSIWCIRDSAIICLGTVPYFFQNFASECPLFVSYFLKILPSHIHCPL